MNRLALDSPLVGRTCVVRQLEVGDHEVLWAAAQRAMPSKGVSVVPTSKEASLALLAEYAELRVRDEGNLYGVTRPDGGDLCGILTLRRTGTLIMNVGEWGIDDDHAREIAADGAALLTEYAHHELGVLRLWLDLDEMDHVVRRLVNRCGYQLESSTAQGDGSIVMRYSSVV